MSENTAKYISAKELSLTVWDWLRKHKGAYKSSLPEEIFTVIREEVSNCPLCTLFHQVDGECSLLCPLANHEDGNCFKSDSLYKRWFYSITKKKEADEIYKVIEAWDPANPVGNV